MECSALICLFPSCCCKLFCSFLFAGIVTLSDELYQIQTICHAKFTRVYCSETTLIRFFFLYLIQVTVGVGQLECIIR